MSATGDFIQFIMKKQGRTEVRLGQALFNSLPAWASEVVRGSLWDPFNKRDMSVTELEEWINSHVIFDHHGFIEGIFNGDTILASAPPRSMD